MESVVSGVQALAKVCKDIRTAYKESQAFPENTVSELERCANLISSYVEDGIEGLLKETIQEMHRHCLALAAIVKSIGRHDNQAKRDLISNTLHLVVPLLVQAKSLFQPTHPKNFIKPRSLGRDPRPETKNLLALRPSLDTPDRRHSSVLPGSDLPEDTLQVSVPKRVSVSIGTPLPKAKGKLEDVYELMQLLGEGVSSQVFLAKNRKTDEYVAVKIVPKKILISNIDLAREIKILKPMNHPQIIRLIDVYLTAESLQIVMEAAEGQELFDEILSRKVFSEQDAREIITKLLYGVAYLHEQGIAHRDLKPENIIFIQEDDGSATLKIIDFGFAKNCTDNSPMYGAAGTLGYKAPEIFSNKPYTTKADMWSVGVITYILLCGYPPFLSSEDDKADINTLMNSPFWSLFNSQTQNLINQVLKGNFTFPSPSWDNISENAKKFVSRLLRVPPVQRMSAAQALTHPWILNESSTTPLKDTLSNIKRLRKSSVSLRERKSSFTVTRRSTWLEKIEELRTY